MKEYQKPNEKELREHLDPFQYQVTQCSLTEPPFQNAYWDNHQPGLYVDIVSGEPLFCSTDKFDSHSGWPSFLRPIDEDKIVTMPDNSMGMHRVEVRSHAANSHLGHVFDDGPQPTGKRFCINSAALRFIPQDRLEAEGYADYAYLFAGKTDKV